MRPWITFYSNTGSEICNISRRRGCYPSAIIGHYNSQLSNSFINELISQQPVVSENTTIYTIPNKPTVEDYERILSKYENPLVTLHGFMRIVPPEICSKYEIYNGHPGLITKYPILKGKDPQLKAFTYGHTEAGTVVHRVTAGVDEGPVVMWNKCSIADCKSPKDVINLLKGQSLECWMEFFDEYNT